MSTRGEQLDFPSMAFAKDRRALVVGEVAEKLIVSTQHVQDLIEEGDLQAVNVGGAGPDYIRVPVCFLSVLATKTGLPEQVISEALQESKQIAQTSATTGRKFWRIPVEAYTAFLKRRHSFHPAQLVKKSQ